MNMEFQCFFLRPFCFYNEDMKKKNRVALLLSLLALSGCRYDRGVSFPLTAAIGTDVSHVTGINVSASTWTSFAWSYPSNDYSFLNTRFVKIEFSIYDEFIGDYGDMKSGAMVLDIQTDIDNFSATMYLDCSTHCLYCGNEFEGAKEAFRSKNQISDYYFDLLKGNS